MPTITLSLEAADVVHRSHLYAEQKRHTVVDCPHVFWSLLQFSETGQDWIAGNYSGSGLALALDAAMEEWYEIGQQSPNPTAAYIAMMRAAQLQATASGEQTISSGYLLNSVLETDTFLSGWLKERGARVASVRVSAPTPLLDQFGRDLTKLAKCGELPTVIGREEEVRQLTEILLRNGKNSALLLGLAGVGKTAVVERLAQHIASGSVPTKLLRRRLIELNIGTLVAGSSFRGELEERLQRILEEIQRTDDVIIVIDEFHMIVGAGRTNSSSVDIANILKPALARGGLTCIGITTFEEYTRHIEGDSAFARRFEKVRVEEPSQDSTREILAGVVTRYEKHHGLQLSAEILDVVVKLAAQYLPSRQFPDKAIDVLGSVCSRAELLQQAATPELVSAIVSDMAGVPVAHLTDGTRSHMTELESALSREVIGQEAATRVVAKAIRLAYTGLRDPRKPKGVFLFVGPSGVGKTQLATSLAEQLFGDSRALLRLDMAEFAEKHTASRLIGAPPGYLGHDEPGQLSQPLRDRPYTVVLLDEIEKAHPEIFDIFLSLFDAGRLTDAHGRPVDGRHAVFIMTSNLGTAPNKHVSPVGFERRLEERGDAIHDALRAFFRPEFLNRIDHIVRFRELDADDLAAIAERALQALKIRMQDQGLRLSYTHSVLEIIAREAARRGAGARGIQRVVEDQVAVPISDLLLGKEASKHRWLHIEVEGGVLVPGWV